MAHRLRYGHVTVAVVVCIAAVAQAPGAARQGPPPPFAPPPGASSKAPSGTGVISGVVVDAATGAPLTDAVVVLSRRATGVVRQLTDAKGRFIFSQLVAGDDYIGLRATKPGYFDGVYGSRNGKAQPITLADGQWLQDLRIELVRPGAIGGTVVDERGEPIVGAYVRALAQVIVAGAPHLAVGPSAKTDDRGMYRLSGLSAGRYVVEVPSVETAVPADTPASVVAGMLPAMASRGTPAPEYQAVGAGTARLVVGHYAVPPPAGGHPQAYPIVFYPNAAGVVEAAPIDLAASQERDGIDFQLRPVPTWRISGRVDGSGSPIAGLLLRLVPPGAEDLGLGSEAATALVDKNGTFEFLDVPAGRYTIDARRSFAELRYNAQGFSNEPSLPTPGFVPRGGGGGVIAAAPPGTSYAYTNGDGDATMWASQPIEVGGADLTGVVVTMRRAVSMTGRVIVEASHASKAPAEGRSPQAPPPFIMVEPADGSTSLGIYTERPDPTTLTFAVNGLMRGRYLIRTLGAGSATSITWNGHDYTYTPIDTSEGQDITGVVITIDPDASPAKITGSVAGVASRPHGAAVIAFPAEPAQWTDYGFQPRRIQATAVTNGGTYQLSVPAGEYYVVAVDGDQANAWQDPRFLRAAAPSATRVSVGWNDTRTQTLQVTEVRP
jgi:hypothetical protein